MARGQTTETATTGEGETPKRRRRSSTPAAAEETTPPAEETPKRRRRPAAETPAETSAEDAAEETPRPRRRRAPATPADVTPYRGRGHDAAMEVARELLTGSYSRVEIVSATEVVVR